MRRCDLRQYRSGGLLLVLTGLLLLSACALLEGGDEPAESEDVNEE